MTRFRLNEPATILLASGAGVVSRVGLDSLLAHELAYAVTYATGRSVLRHYAVVVPFFVMIPLMIGVARAASVSVALPVASLTAAVVLAWWTYLSRRQEIAADLYAIELTGDLAGAAELMDLYVFARTKSGRFGTLLHSLEGTSRPARRRRRDWMRWTATSSPGEQLVPLHTA
ncbi:Zn-dependent protease with chaperone function [Marmoricola sp. URHA0025 HA25]